MADDRGAGLREYHRKRRFSRTPEPRGEVAPERRGGDRVFVVQKHAASRLHYDFRLELEGVLKSWAVPKGPSLDPADKRLAMHVEDHPLEYGSFEGIIPKGEYGGGTVLLWDRGRWFPIGDAAQGFREGKLKFRLEGSKLKGGFTLVRMRQREGERQTAWLLIKEKDSEARSAQEYDVLVERGESVAGSSRRARSAKKAVPPRKTAGSKAADRLALPSLLSPQLATLVSAPPASGEWQYELKLDGYRLLARVDGDHVAPARRAHDGHVLVPTHVAQDAHRARLVAHHDQAPAAHRDRQEVARLGDLGLGTDRQPVGRENRAFLGLEGIALGVILRFHSSSYTIRLVERR